MAPIKYHYIISDFFTYARTKKGFWANNHAKVAWQRRFYRVTNKQINSKSSRPLMMFDKKDVLPPLKN